MKINIKLLSDKATVPVYQSAQASGFDFHSTEAVNIMPNETKLIPTGLAFEIPDNYEIQVRPRSGLSAKTGIRVVNSPGTVDSDFRGQVQVILQNTGTIPFFVEIGDRIAQGVLCPIIRAEFEVTDELLKTERESRGFGSTGKK